MRYRRYLIIAVHDGGVATTDDLAEQWRRFADVQARGRSALYADVALDVADEPDLLALLAGRPMREHQPNLLLAAVQYLAGPMSSVADFREVVASRTDDLLAVMASHATQTNVPARCATLLPALAAIDGPLALLEVGASAGLCLLPDRYAYAYTLDDGTTVSLEPARPHPRSPVLSCGAGTSVPLPTAVPEIVWRAGLDLDPVDLEEPDARAWLEALVWPGEEHLREQLRDAIAVARDDPPPVHRGDLAADLPALAAQAPRDATLVIMHSAVLPYVDPAHRVQFAEAVAGTGAVWLANENPTTIPGLDLELIGAHPPDLCVLCRDGRPLARTDPHGARVEWLPPVPAG